MTAEPQDPPGEKPGFLRILVSAFLPGLLAGTQITGLLFFLNPHLPFEPGAVLRGVGFFGFLLGGLGALILLPLFWRQPRRTGQRLSQALTLVLALAAISAWVHVSSFAFFLPPGINRRLLKAATWLSLAAVVCFYTMLVHRLRRRPYGRRSQALFLLVGLASVYVVLERREAFKPTPGPAPRETTIEGSQRPRLVVVGIESATLDAILPLTQQERLPFFSRLLEESFYARLSPLDPPRRLPLWTTLVAGKYPYQHGILSRRVYRAAFLNCEAPLYLLPIGMGFRDWGSCRGSRSIASSDRQVLVLWQILSRLGVPTGVIGWPLTAPPSEDTEILISDKFFEDSSSAEDLVPGDLAERARLFHTPREEIDPRMLAPFGSAPPASVVDSLRQDLWREALSFYVLENHPDVEALFIGLPGMLAVSEEFFRGYSDVQFDGSQKSEDLDAARVMSAYYMHLDEYLAQLWEQISGPKMMAVVSVLGSESSSGVDGWIRRLSPQASFGSLIDESPDGVLMILGEGIQAGQMPSAQLVDFAPTLLYALGAPLARDLDGAVLTEAFTSAFLARQPLTFIPSYETLSGGTE